jgi:hypothetical protein
MRASLSGIGVVSFAAITPDASVIHGVDPPSDLGVDQRPGRRGHPPVERPDVVLAEVAGALAVCGVGVRCDLPHRVHGDLVDMPEFLGGDQASVRPVAGFESLRVHPLGGVGVALDLHVLLEWLGTDGLAALQEELDLTQHEGVSLERRGVMRLEVPDVRPDGLGLLRRGQTAQAVPQLGQGCLQPGVDGCPRRPSARHHTSS